MNKKFKWKLYEKRSQFRNFYFHKVIRRHIFEKYFDIDPVIPFYANQWVMGKKKTNCWIADKIREGTPFMAGRFGNTELSVMTSVLKRRMFGDEPEIQERFEEWFHNLGELSGFFPEDPVLAEKFTDLMLDSCKDVDILAMYHCYMDDYVITEYMPKTRVSFLNNIEPWRCRKPWTAALKGKKVLVIHPFEESIKEQYRKHDLLFPGTEVLPDFELKTLKAVQTIAGEKDERFATWFDALDYMYQEALKIDFDVAILGCGAYGFPLAVKLKNAGKQAVHMGGVTQILFGIKGRRWIDNPRSGIKFNEAWIYPKESETPKNCKVVENHCYW
ncbi:MAG: hypothetical protein HDR24_14320 [Lachnospiraceae bacterium]|nr:hypothetical protein [Lachnospiraceae bacterium]